MAIKIFITLRNYPVLDYVPSKELSGWQKVVTFPNTHPFHQKIDTNLEKKGLRISGVTYFLILSYFSRNLNFGKNYNRHYLLIKKNNIQRRTGVSQEKNYLITKAEVIEMETSVRSTNV